MQRQMAPFQSLEPPGGERRSDSRRSNAALLSFIWPGLGQLYRGEGRRALLYAVPPLLAMLALAVALAGGLLGFAVRLLLPDVALTVVVILLLLAGWRVLAIFDARRPRRASSQRGGGRSFVVAVLLSALVVACHGALGYYTWSVYDAGSRIYQPLETPTPSPTSAPPSPSQSSTPGVTPAPSASLAPVPTLGDEMVNVLVVGFDRGVGGTANSDTLIVASFDPQTDKLVMISLPRDTAQVPLYNGRTWNTKINAFYNHAERHPEQYPGGGMAALVEEMSYLVGVPIPYYISIDIPGYRRLIDVVGGVDIVLDRPIDDPTYQFGPGRTGFHLEAGEHHLDGALAEAYVRSRHGTGNSDFARARRQQQVLLALRQRADDPEVLVNLPTVLDAVADVVQTNVPLDRLPELLEIVEGSRGAAERNIVLGPRRYAQQIPPAEVNGLYALRLKLDELAALSISLWGDQSRYADEPPPSR
jgi:LCP family protein required for cell wall assembly